MELAKGSHCKYKMRYHIVWSVKYGHEMLFGDRITFLKYILQEIAQRYDFIVEAVGTDKNHVHVFAGAHPVISPSSAIQKLKSISAREMFRKYPDIKRFLWGGSLWSIGYFVRTVSDGPLEYVIKQYVENQGKVWDDPEEFKQLELKMVP